MSTTPQLTAPLRIHDPYQYGACNAPATITPALTNHLAGMHPENRAKMPPRFDQAIAGTHADITEGEPARLPNGRLCRPYEGCQVALARLIFWWFVFGFNDLPPATVRHGTARLGVLTYLREIGQFAPPGGW